MMIPRLSHTRDLNQNTIPWYFLLLNVISFISLSILAFRYNVSYLFYAEDGHYMMTLAREASLWRGFEFGLTNNFLQSIGDPWFPMNAMIIPGYVALNLMNGHVIYSQVAAYTIFAFEFFLIGLLVSRFINLGWNFALVTAWVLPLVAFPYYYNPFLYNIMNAVPQSGTMIVVTNLIILLYATLGRHSIRTSLLISACILFLIFYIAIASPAVIMLSVPVIFIFCLTSLLLSSSSREKKHKLLFSLGMLLILAISGILPYCYGLFKYSVPSYFSSDLYIGADKPSWIIVSLLFREPFEKYLYITALSGVVYSAIYEKELKRTIAIGLLVTMICLSVFGTLIVIFNFWHGPVPVYFEFILWPFYVAYSVKFISLIINFCKNKLLRNYQVTTNLIACSLIILFPWLMFLYPKPHPDGWNVPNPPLKSSIVEMLNQQISLIPGKQFKGRVANFTGSKLKHPAMWPDAEENDCAILRKTGNDHRMNGLWYYNIPTLDVDGPFISPSYFQFTKAILSLPEDRQMRSIMFLRHPDIRWLTALGVRFVITDAPLKGALKREQMSLDELGDLYLYELTSPNLGQYSPTKVIRLENIGSTIKVLMKNDFNPENQIVVADDLPQTLVQSKDGKIMVDKGFLKVTASSQGDSILLLPLEYSRCLTIVSHATDAQMPRLFRANATQTGVLFHHRLDATIRYFTGPFNNSTCRIKDARDFEKISA